jgi:hypothetical protein
MANMKAALYTYITLIYYTALWLGVAIRLIQLQVQKIIANVIFIFVRNALRTERHQRDRPRKRTHYKVLGLCKITFKGKVALLAYQQEGGVI